MKRAGWARQQRANSPTWNSNYSIDIPHTITLSSLICITPLGSPQQMNAYDLVRGLQEFRRRMSGGVFHLLLGTAFVSNTQDKLFDYDQMSRMKEETTFHMFSIYFLAQLSLRY